MGQSSIVIHKGGREAKYEICVEDYVISFLKKETDLPKLSAYYFYGYREKGGRKYVIFGAGRERGLAVFEKYSLLEEIGCRLTQAGPVFSVREGEDIYEIKGYDIFYQENGEMQNYLITQKTTDGVRADRGARASRTADRGRKTDRGPVSSEIPHNAISLQLGVLLVALTAIVINSANSYDKMRRLNRSASEVFFAMENQEAEGVPAAVGGQDEITVERDMPQEDAMQGELLKENAQSDTGQEDMLRLVTLENEGHAGEDGAEADAQDGGDETDAQTMQESAGIDEAEQDGADEDGTEESTGEASAEPAREGGTAKETAADETRETAGDERKDGTNGETPQEEGDTSSDGEEVEALSRNVARYYKVERGDTLYMISKKVYGDTSHVKKICEVNNITDPDHIHYGQKIILP